MIQDLYRSFKPSSYKNLLIKNQPNCLIFALKVFLVTLIITVLLNVPQIITTNYAIEDFTKNINSIEILVKYKDEIKENFIDQKVENKTSLTSNTVNYDFEVIDGEVEFENYFKENKTVYRNLNFNNHKATNQFNNLIYSLYLIMAPGILMILAFQALVYIASIIIITMVVLILMSKYMYQLDFNRAIKIPLLASPILTIPVLINYIFRLHIINLAAVLYWSLVILIILELSTLKSEQRAMKAKYSERRKFLELNLTRYYDKSKLLDLEKQEQKWYKKLIFKLTIWYQKWRYGIIKEDNWVDYSKENNDNKKDNAIKKDTNKVNKENIN